MRKPRILKVGAEYHVMARINRQEMIFDKDVFKTMFVEVLCRARKKYPFSFRNFCIMGNHVHLIIRPKGRPKGRTSLSRLMQWILSVFARKFNDHRGYKGHVWYDRFKSKIIESLAQLDKTNIYLMMNPKAIKTLDDFRNYEFCGFHHIKTKRFDLIDKPDEITMAGFEKVMNIA